MQRVTVIQQKIVGPPPIKPMQTQNMSTYRVIAFDLGNKVSGCVVADIIFGGCFHVVHMEAFENKSVSEMTAAVADYLENKENIVILYENTFMFKNWTLMRMQKALRAYYKSINPPITIKALLPSQKYKVAFGVNKKRKQSSVATASGLIATMTNEIIAQFQGLGRRKHDVADALLMIKYVYENPRCIE